MNRPTASGLGRAMRCPASMHLPIVDRVSPESLRGSWRHAFLAKLAGGALPHEAALAVPEEHRAACEALPIDQLPTSLTAELALGFNAITGRARILGTDIGRNYPELAGDELAGTADVVGLGADQIYVCDWKSGGSTERARDSLQLRFLALAASRAYRVESAKVEIIALGDDGDVRRSWHTYDALDLDLFAAQLRDWWVTARERREPVEGEHCAWCKSFAYCPAKAQLALTVAEGRVLDEPVATLPLSPERAGIVWQRVKAARKMLDHLERACIATMDEAGSLPLPGGGSLVRRTVAGNERLAGETVFEVVAENHGADLARRAVEMVATKTGLRDALRPLGTKRGQLARLEGEVLDEVRKRGGVTRKPRSSIEEVEAGAELPP